MNASSWLAACSAIALSSGLAPSAEGAVETPRPSGYAETIASVRAALRQAGVAPTPELSSPGVRLAQWSNWNKWNKWNKGG
jgi:hypothetical protein